MQEHLSLTQKQQFLTRNNSTAKKRSRSANSVVTKRKRHGVVIHSSDHKSVTSCCTVVEVIQYEKIQKLLQAGNTWKFNVFDFKRITEGSPLSYLGVSLFEKHDLIKHFKLDPVKLLHTFSKIEDGYVGVNSYHSSVHAADVMQAINCLLTEDKLRKTLAPFDVLCSLVAAVCHDLDHPGVNNLFLVRTNNYLAKLYKESSVLENHHWRVAISILKQTGLFDHFDSKTWCSLKTRISEMIMATDISRQNNYLERFQKMIDNLKEMDTEESIKHVEQNRKLILEIALKCADISNPCRSWDISLEWSGLVCEEFFNQGDEELRLGLPVTFSRRTGIPNIQTYFIANLVKPLFNAWHSFMNTTQSQSMQSSINSNLSIWQEKADVIKKNKEQEEKKMKSCKEEENSEISKHSESESNQKQNQLICCVAAVTTVSAVAGLATVAAISAAAKILSSSQNNLPLSATAASTSSSRQLSPSSDYGCTVGRLLDAYDDANPVTQHTSRRSSLPMTLGQMTPFKSFVASFLALEPENHSTCSNNLGKYESDLLRQRRISLPATRFSRNALSNMGASHVDSQFIGEINNLSSDKDENSTPDSPLSVNYTQAPFPSKKRPSFSPRRRASAPFLGSSLGNFHCATSRRANRTNLSGGVAYRQEPLTEGTPINYDAHENSDIESALLESTSSDNLVESPATSIVNQARPRGLQFFNPVDHNFVTKPRSNSVDMSGTYGNLSTLNAHLRLLTEASMTVNKSNNCASQMNSLASLHSCYSSNSDIMAVM